MIRVWLVAAAACAAGLAVIVWHSPIAFFAIPLTAAFLILAFRLLVACVGEIEQPDQGT